ncbi:hypothetical protein ILUMI_05866 [Ignelater luminosus]|uniref:Ig-like domain-containing protein n=1 Tax=Ignelater luminosus TaxID=2038154 RepID=A0A8K0D6D5_IGNLU|nr:hypothetical protein ILUMI_05866 [Ignelater luminosus]
MQTQLSAGQQPIKISSETIPSVPPLTNNSIPVTKLETLVLQQPPTTQTSLNESIVNNTVAIFTIQPLISKPESSAVQQSTNILSEVNPSIPPSTSTLVNLSVTKLETPILQQTPKTQIPLTGSIVNKTVALSPIQHLISELEPLVEQHLIKIPSKIDPLPDLALAELSTNISYPKPEIPIQIPTPPNDTWSIESSSTPPLFLTVEVLPGLQSTNTPLEINFTLPKMPSIGFPINLKPITAQHTNQIPTLNKFPVVETSLIESIGNKSSIQSLALQPELSMRQQSTKIPIELPLGVEPPTNASLVQQITEIPSLNNFKYMTPSSRKLTKNKSNQQSLEMYSTLPKMTSTETLINMFSFPKVETTVVQQPIEKSSLNNSKKPVGDQSINQQSVKIPLVINFVLPAKTSTETLIDKFSLPKVELTVTPQTTEKQSLKNSRCTTEPSIKSIENQSINQQSVKTPSDINFMLPKMTSTETLINLFSFPKSEPTVVEQKAKLLSPYTSKYTTVSLIKPVRNQSVKTPSDINFMLPKMTSTETLVNLFSFPESEPTVVEQKAKLLSPYTSKYTTVSLIKPVRNQSINQQSVKIPLLINFVLPKMTSTETLTNISLFPKLKPTVLYQMAKIPSPDNSEWTTPISLKSTNQQSVKAPLEISSTLPKPFLLQSSTSKPIASAPKLELPMYQQSINLSVPIASLPLQISVKNKSIEISPVSKPGSSLNQSSLPESVTNKSVKLSSARHSVSKPPKKHKSTMAIRSLLTSESTPAHSLSLLKLLLEEPLQTPLVQIPSFPVETQTPSTPETLSTSEPNPFNQSTTSMKKPNFFEYLSSLDALQASLFSTEMPIPPLEFEPHEKCTLISIANETDTDTNSEETETPEINLETDTEFASLHNLSLVKTSEKPLVSPLSLIFPLKYGYSHTETIKLNIFIGDSFTSPTPASISIEHSSSTVPSTLHLLLTTLTHAPGKAGKFTNATEPSRFYSFIGLSNQKQQKFLQNISTESPHQISGLLKQSFTAEHPIPYILTSPFTNATKPSRFYSFIGLSNQKQQTFLQNISTESPHQMSGLLKQSFTAEPPIPYILTSLSSPIPVVNANNSASQFSALNQTSRINYQNIALSQTADLIKPTEYSQPLLTAAFSQVSSIVKQNVTPEKQNAWKQVAVLPNMYTAAPLILHLTAVADNNTGVTNIKNNLVQMPFQLYYERSNQDDPVVDLQKAPLDKDVNIMPDDNSNIGRHALNVRQTFSYPDNSKDFAKDSPDEQNYDDDDEKTPSPNNTLPHVKFVEPNPADIQPIEYENTITFQKPHQPRVFSNEEIMFFSKLTEPQFNLSSIAPTHNSSTHNKKTSKHSTKTYQKPPLEIQFPTEALPAKLNNSQKQFSVQNQIKTSSLNNTFPTTIGSNHLDMTNTENHKQTSEILDKNIYPNSENKSSKFLNKDNKQTSKSHIDVTTSTELKHVPSNETDVVTSNGESCISNEIKNSNHSTEMQYVDEDLNTYSTKSHTLTNFPSSSENMPSKKIGLSSHKKTHKPHKTTGSAESLATSHKLSSSTLKTSEHDGPNASTTKNHTTSHKQSSKSLNEDTTLENTQSTQKCLETDNTENNTSSSIQTSSEASDQDAQCLSNLNETRSKEDNSDYNSTQDYKSSQKSESLIEDVNFLSDIYNIQTKENSLEAHRTNSCNQLLLDQDVNFLFPGPDDTQTTKSSHKQIHSIVLRNKDVNISFTTVDIPPTTRKEVTSSYKTTHQQEHFSKISKHTKITETPNIVANIPQEIDDEGLKHFPDHKQTTLCEICNETETIQEPDASKPHQINTTYETTSELSRHEKTKTQTASLENRIKTTGTHGDKSSLATYMATSTHAPSTNNRDENDELINALHRGTTLSTKKFFNSLLHKFKSTTQSNLIETATLTSTVLGGSHFEQIGKEDLTSSIATVALTHKSVAESVPLPITSSLNTRNTITSSKTDDKINKGATTNFETKSSLTTLPCTEQDNKEITSNGKTNRHDSENKSTILSNSTTTTTTTMLFDKAVVTSDRYFKNITEPLTTEITNAGKLSMPKSKATNKFTSTNRSTVTSKKSTSHSEISSTSSSVTELTNSKLASYLFNTTKSTIKTTTEMKYHISHSKEKTSSTIEASTCGALEENTTRLPFNMTTNVSVYTTMVQNKTISDRIFSKMFNKTFTTSVVTKTTHTTLSHHTSEIETSNAKVGNKTISSKIYSTMSSRNETTNSELSHAEKTTVEIPKCLQTSQELETSEDEVHEQNSTSTTEDVKTLGILREVSKNITLSEIEMEHEERVPNDTARPAVSTAEEGFLQSTSHHIAVSNPEPSNKKEPIEEELFMLNGPNTAKAKHNVRNKSSTAEEIQDYTLNCTIYPIDDISNEDMMSILEFLRAIRGLKANVTNKTIETNSENSTNSKLQNVPQDMDLSSTNVKTTLEAIKETSSMYITTSNQETSTKSEKDYIADLLRTFSSQTTTENHTLTKDGLPELNSDLSQKATTESSLHSYTATSKEIVLTTNSITLPYYTITSTSTAQHTKENSTINQTKSIMETTKYESNKSSFDFHITLPVYPLNSTASIESYEKYYSSTVATRSKVMDDEATDCILNKNAFRTMKYEDFIVITEFPPTTTLVESNGSCNVTHSTSHQKSTSTQMDINMAHQPKDITSVATSNHQPHGISNNNETKISGTTLRYHLKAASFQSSDNDESEEMVYHSKKTLGSTNKLIKATTKSSLLAAFGFLNKQTATESSADTTIEIPTTTVSNTTEASNIPSTTVVHSSENITSESVKPYVTELPNLLLESTCNLSDYQAKNHCICSIDNLIKDLRIKFANNPLDIIMDNYTCPIFRRIDIGIIVGNESIPQVVKTRRDTDYYFEYIKKRDLVENKNIDRTLNEQFELKNTENEMFATPGMKIEIPCFNTMKEVPEKIIKYDWTFSDNLPLTEGKVQESGGTLIIENLSPQDGGNYTCTVKMENENSKKYEHHLSIISLPTYTATARILYNTSNKCEETDSDILFLYFPNVLGSMLCGDYFKACKIELKEPHCSGEYIHINISVIVEPINVIMPTLNTMMCDFNCQIRIYNRIVAFIIKNLEAIEKLTVFFRLSFRKQAMYPMEQSLKKTKHWTGTELPKLLIACPPGFGYHKRSHICGACGRNKFSRGDETHCTACPAGQYQPMVGSRSCLKCTSPLQDPYCLRVVYSNAQKFRIAIGITATFLILMSILLVCCRRSKGESSSRNAARNGRNEYLKSKRNLRRRSRDIDIEKQDTEPLLDKHKSKKYKSKKPPEPPPPDFF